MPILELSSILLPVAISIALRIVPERECRKDRGLQRAAAGVRTFTLTAFLTNAAVIFRATPCSPPFPLAPSSSRCKVNHLEVIMGHFLYEDDVRVPER
jgi:hypothetical protein